MSSHTDDDAAVPPALSALYRAGAVETPPEALNQQLLVAARDAVAEGTRTGRRPTSSTPFDGESALVSRRRRRWYRAGLLTTAAGVIAALVVTLPITRPPGMSRPPSITAESEAPTVAAKRGTPSPARKRDEPVGPGVASRHSAPLKSLRAAGDASPQERAAENARSAAPAAQSTVTGAAGADSTATFRAAPTPPGLPARLRGQFRGEDGTQDVVELLEVNGGVVLRASWPAGADPCRTVLQLPRLSGAPLSVEVIDTPEAGKSRQAIVLTEGEWRRKISCTDNGWLVESQERGGGGSP